MKNKEYYKQQIYECMLLRNSAIAVDKRTGELQPCETFPLCDECLLNSKSASCSHKWKQWLEQEHVEPILDEVEKRYLESVIRPFRNRVENIRKSNIGEEYTFIRIFVKCYKPEKSIENITLPFFDGTKMYTGMKRNKDYTLDELGLFQEDNHVTDQ